MKNLLLISLLCFCVNAYAFNWKKVSKSEDEDFIYVDTKSIKEQNGLVHYWELIDSLEPALGANSAISKYKVDCGKEKVTYLTDTYYSQSMGKEK